MFLAFPAALCLFLLPWCAAQCPSTVWTAPSSGWCSGPPDTHTLPDLFMRTDHPSDSLLAVTLLPEVHPSLVNHFLSGFVVSYTTEAADPRWLYYKEKSGPDGHYSIRVFPGLTATEMESSGPLPTLYLTTPVVCLSVRLHVRPFFPLNGACMGADLLLASCASNPQTPTLYPNPACGSGQQLQYGQCKTTNASYYFGVQTLATASEAQSDCLFRGGNLVSLHSAAEMDAMIAELVLDSPLSTWIIGLEWNELGEFPYWMDDTEVDFTAWAGGQPSYDLQVPPIVLLNKNLGWRWVTGGKARVICKIDQKFSRRLVGGYYRAPVSHLSSSKYVTKGSHSSYHRSSLVNGRYGQDQRFYLSTGSEVYERDDGFKPVFSAPLYTKGPYMEVTFDMPMVIEAVILENRPNGSSPNRFIFKYSANNKLVTYKASGQKRVVQIPPGTQYPVTTVFDPPIQTTLFSVHMVSSGETSTRLFWDVIGYMSESVPQLNLCELGDHGCTSQCLPTPGSYRCACESDFRLHPNGKDCIHDQICPSSYVRIGDNCYRIEEAAVTYSQALADCLTDVASLASIHSRKEFELLRRELAVGSRATQNFFIGLRGTKLLKERWSDASWVERTYFFDTVPEELAEPHVVYLDKDLYRAWSFGPENATTAGYICKQLDNFCAVPQLAGPFPPYYTITSSSGTAESIILTTPDAGVFIHDPNTGESPVWVQVAFLDEMSVSGFVFSSGDQAGPASFRLFYSTDGVDYLPVLDKLQEEPQVFTLSRPPSALAYYWITPIVASYVRLEYTRPGGNSLRYGIAMEILGCPVTAGVSTGHYCENTATYYRRFPDHVQQFQCNRYCLGAQVDSTVTCADSRLCKLKYCFNGAACFEDYAYAHCLCTAGFTNLRCNYVILRGFQFIVSTANGLDSEDLYAAVFVEASPEDAVIYLDFDDDFHIDVRYSMLATVSGIAANNPTYDLSFLNSYSLTGHIGYVLQYRFNYMGVYNLTAVATSHFHTYSSFFVVTIMSLNPCPTSISVSSLPPSYLDRKVYLDSVEIRFQTAVDIQCQATSVLSRLWEWKLFFLTEHLPQPDPANRVIFTTRTITDQSSLVLLPKTLPPGLYKVEAHLNVTIAPFALVVTASAHGYIVVVEPAVYVSIIGGTFRTAFRGRVLHVEATVSSFYPPDVVPANIEDRFSWTCTIGLTACDFVPAVWPGTYTDNTIPVYGPMFDIPANSLRVGENYTFVVYLEQIGFGNVQTLTYTQTVSILSPSIPDVRIVCAINCGTTVRSGEKMTLMAVCATCAVTTDLTYLWELHPLNASSGPLSLDWGVDTGTLEDEDVLVINPYVMDPGFHYQITVHGTDPNGLEGHADLVFQTTEVLASGQCTVHPNSGQAMKTSFRLECRDFVGETALTYKVFLSVSDLAKDRWSLLSESYLPSLTIGMLPRGTKAGSTHKLRVTVLTQTGVSVSTLHTVRVYGLGGGTEGTLVNLVLGTSADDASPLDKASMMDRPEAVVGLMTSVVPELNSATTGSGHSTQKSQMREKLIEVLSVTETNDSSLLQPSAFVLDGLLSTDKDMVSGSMLDNVADGSDNLARKFTEAVVRDTPLDAEKTAQYLLSGMSRLQNIVRVQAETTIKNSGKTASALLKSRNLTSVALRQKESILRALARHKYPGEESSRYEGEDTVMLVRRDTPLSLNGEMVLDPQTHQGGCAIPWNVADLTGTGVTEVTTETMINKYDPYPWGDSDLGVPANQSSVSLELVSKETGRMDLRDLSTPLDVFIPVNKKERTLSWEGPFTIYVYYYTETGEVVREPSLPMALPVACPPGYTAMVKLSLGGRTLGMTVLIKAGTPITSSQEFYMDGVMLVHLPHPEPPANQTFVQDRNTIFLESTDYDTIIAMNASAGCGNPNITCPSGSPPVLSANSSRPFYLGFVPTAGQILATGQWAGNCYNFSCEVSMAELEARVSVVSTACVFWSEEENRWSTTGCAATRFSTPDQIHCSCNRVAVFSTSIFVLPNLVDPIRDILLFLTFFENPLMVSVVLCIWLLYLVLLIWARHRDRHDDSLSGVTVLTDNQPGDPYMYLVGVATGWWADSDTTANVFVFLEGTRGRSLRHALSDGRRNRFCKGADDWFLLTTPESLGDLESVTIWHDNSGTSPSWFLKSVTVQDLQTHNTWTFMHNDWLSLDRGSLHIMVTLPAFTTREILKNSTLQFLAKWSHDMRDQHLWFSIFAKPLQSPFTRVQRLSCALVLLLTAMLTNLMFYGIPTDQDQVNVQGLVISVTTIMIGLETALVMFPINFILVQLFLRVKPRMSKFMKESLRKKKAEEEISGRDSEEMGMGSSEIQLAETSLPDSREQSSEQLRTQNSADKDREGTSFGEAMKDNSSMDNFINQDAVLQNLNNSARSGTKGYGRGRGTEPSSGRNTKAPKTDSVSAHTTDPSTDTQTSESQVTLSVGTSYTGLDTESVDAGGRAGKDETRSAGTGLSMLEQENKTELLMEADLSTPASDIGMVQENTERGQRSEAEGEAAVPGDGNQDNPNSTPTALMTRKLPWWFLYINWVLLTLTALTCSFFVMLYGLRFGYSRSRQWALSFFTSFLTSALISEPFKVVLMALLITVILKRHVTDKYETVREESEVQESLVKQTREGFEESEIAAAPQSFTQRGLQAIRERVRMEWRIQELVREVTFYLVFVVVVVLVAHGHKHVGTCYRATKSVEDMFIHATYVNNTQPFSEVATVEDMWEYISGTFLPNLYAVPQEAGPLQSYPPLCADGVTLPVGLARLRQIRHKPGRCVGVVAPIPAALGPCKTLEFYTLEDTSSYSRSWGDGVVSESGHWTYQSGWQLQTIPYIGRYSSYSGGGYVAEIPNTDTARDTLIQSLQTDLWVDQRTMVIFIEFTVYNPGKNLFSVVMLSLEFIGTGEILPFHQILTTKLYHYGSDFEVFVAVCEVLFILQTLSLMYYEIKRLRVVGRVQYFRNPWSYAELLTVCLCIVTVAMYIQRTFIVSSAIEEMKDSNGERFVNFYTAGLWDYILGYVFAFLVLLVILKVFKLVRFNKRLTLFGLTMRISGLPILRFSFMTFTYFMPFVHVGWLVFGSSLESYKNPVATGLTLFDFALGVSDYLGLSSVSCYVGPLFFLVFIFAVQFCLINMLIILILEAFSVARLQIKDEPNDYEVVDYILKQILLAVGVHSHKQSNKGKKKKRL